MYDLDLVGNGQGLMLRTRRPVDVADVAGHSRWSAHRASTLHGLVDYVVDMAKSKKPSKTAFVRSLPTSMSAKDVVAKAKDQGITISQAYVYSIRSSSRRHGTSRSNGGRQSTEMAFRRLVFEIGVSKARALLEDVEKKLQALIAGR